MLSTTVEKFKRFENKLASLWMSRDGADWRCVWQKEKDIWPMKYFQYGSIITSQGRMGSGHHRLEWSGIESHNRVLLGDIVDAIEEITRRQSKMNLKDTLVLIRCFGCYPLVQGLMHRCSGGRGFLST